MLLPARPLPLTPAALGSLTPLQIHHDAKHPKLPWEPEKCTNMHDVVGVTTQGVAVRGSTKKK